MLKKYAIIALVALAINSQASGMGAWSRKLWAPAAVATVGVFGSKTALCEEKPSYWQQFKAKIGWTQSCTVDIAAQPTVSTQPSTSISKQIMDLFARSMASENKEALFDGGKRLNVGSVEIIDIPHNYPSANPFYDIEKGRKRIFGFETTISGTREELSHPSLKVEEQGYVSRDGIDSVWNKEGYPSGSRTGSEYDKYGQIRPYELNKFLQLRTNILLAIEQARTKEQQALIDNRTFEEASSHQEANSHFSIVDLFAKRFISIMEDSAFFVTPEERKRREKISEVRLDDRTKCAAPVFYGDGSRGWIRCKTAFVPSDLDKI